MRTLTVQMLFAVFASLAFADIVPEGHHSVAHVLVLEDDARLSEVRLFLAPVRGFAGVEAWLPGVEARFSGKYGTRVYALRPGVEAPDTPDALKEVAFAMGEIPVGHESFVPEVDPTRRIVSTVRLVEIDGEAITLEEVETRRFAPEADGSSVEVKLIPMLPVLGGVVLLGLVLVVVLFARRRQART